MREATRRYMRALIEAGGEFQQTAVYKAIKEDLGADVFNVQKSAWRRHVLDHETELATQLGWIRDGQEED